jgi:hypothetical protein
MSASASGRINRAFFKIWDAARLRLAVLRIMFTSFAISLKKFPTAKVLEILKKDSSKFAKTLNSSLRDFHWQDGYGLFSVSPSHFEAVRQYILSQEEHHRKETFQEEYLRILKKYRAPYDERNLWD